MNPLEAHNDPVFTAPWQAQAFAMTVALAERGLFSWTEWTAALSDRVRDANDGGDGYYEAWVAALSDLLVGKGVADAAAIEALGERWQRAAEATAHGDPIRLENDPGTDPARFSGS